MTKEDLEMLENLTYLNIPSDHKQQLTDEVEAIINFVEQLRQVNIEHVEPWVHPLDLSQRCRSDEVIEKSHEAELRSVAPLFEEDLYLVPKVINMD